MGRGPGSHRKPRTPKRRKGGGKRKGILAILQSRRDRAAAGRRMVSRYKGNKPK